MNTRHVNSPNVVVVVHYICIFTCVVLTQSVGACVMCGSFVPTCTHAAAFVIPVHRSPHHTTHTHTEKICAHARDEKRYGVVVETARMFRVETSGSLENKSFRGIVMQVSRAMLSKRKWIKTSCVCVVQCVHVGSYADLCACFLLL